MATTVTCPHGMQQGTCLICSTLAPASAGGAAGSVPARRREERQTHIRLGVLGWLVVAAAVLFGAWFLVHLVWTFLHLVELALVGVVCGAVGYRVGVFVGRHRR